MTSFLNFAKNIEKSEKLQIDNFSWGIKVVKQQKSGKPHHFDDFFFLVKNLNIENFKKLNHDGHNQS